MRPIRELEAEKSKLKEVFLIKSYCDNAKKTQLLKETLNHLKPLNLPMCVHDAAGVEENLIQAGADYLIVDPSNPIPPLRERSLYVFASIPCNGKIILTHHTPDVGGACAHQHRSGLSYLSSLGYDVAHLIDYDTFIDLDFFTKKASPQALKYDAVLYGADGFEGSWRLSTIFCSINLHRCDKIIRSISFDDYIATSRLPDGYFEIYMSRKILDSSDLTINKVPFEDIKDLIYDKYSRFYDEVDPLSNTGLKERYDAVGHTAVFRASSVPATHFWFGRKKTLGTLDKSPASVIFYDVKEDFEAKLVINEQVFETKVKKSKVIDYFLFESAIESKDVKSAQLIINGNVVIDEVYDNSLLNSIEFW